MTRTDFVIVLPLRAVEILRSRSPVGELAAQNDGRGRVRHDGEDGPGIHGTTLEHEEILRFARLSAGYRSG